VKPPDPAAAQAVPPAGAPAPPPRSASPFVVGLGLGSGACVGCVAIGCVALVTFLLISRSAVPRLIGGAEDARLAKASADISTLESTLEQYVFDVGSYPTTDEGLQALVRNVGNRARWNGPYLRGSIPSDPWNGAYQYRTPGQMGRAYDVFSCGPDKKPRTKDDIGNWEPVP